MCFTAENLKMYIRDFVFVYMCLTAKNLKLYRLYDV